MFSSKMKAALAETALKDAGYIESYSVEDIGGNKKNLTVVPKYKETQYPGHRGTAPNQQAVLPRLC